MPIHDYIIDQLPEDVQAIIENYEGFTDIDDFMNGVLNDQHWFYEATIQGWIYQLLYSGYQTTFLFFLEQPYNTAAAQGGRSDITFVEHGPWITSAIEVKSDFVYESMLVDMQVLNAQINAGNIASGYGIFCASSEAQIQDWQTKFAQEPDLTLNFQNGRLFSVGIVGEPR